MFLPLHPIVLSFPLISVGRVELMPSAHLCNLPRSYGLQPAQDLGASDRYISVRSVCPFIYDHICVHDYLADQIACSGKKECLSHPFGQERPSLKSPTRLRPDNVEISDRLGKQMHIVKGKQWPESAPGP
jgi:hypothetical protein